MKSNDLDHDRLVSDWQENAKKKDDENYWFLHSLKRRADYEKVDRIALELHNEAFKIVDCTKCANCCRTLPVEFTAEDIARIAAHLGMGKEEFVATYLSKDEEGQYWTKTKPCPFLGGDNKCTIYDVRPTTCQKYPYTDKPDVAHSTISRANHALVCPAAFYIVEQMKERLGG